MASKSSRSADFSTQKLGLLGRFAFTNGLFELQENNGRKNWTATLLLPKTLDLSPLHALALEAAEKQWGGKMDVKAAIKDGLIKSPFLDGDGKQGRSKKPPFEPHNGFPGNWFLRLTSGEEYRPKLVNAKLLPIVSKDELKSGDWGYLFGSFYTWENSENGMGITCGMSIVMKAKDGESLGGGGAPAPDAVFNAIPDEGAAPASTQGGAGARGLFDDPRKGDDLFK